MKYDGLDTVLFWGFGTSKYKIIIINYMHHGVPFELCHFGVCDVWTAEINSSETNDKHE